MISTHNAGGKRYYLIHDPRMGIQHLVNEGVIKDEELFVLNELARELKQAPFRREAPQQPKVAPVIRMAQRKR